jgi:SAM-dependent methyltransferase
LRRLDALLRESGIDCPTIIDVGPGGVTRLAAPLLNDSSRNVGRLRKLVGDAARYSDQALRRIPFLSMRSLEPLEIAATLSMPHRLVVVDRSRRVLAAVRRDLPNVDCRCLDISREPIPLTADAVIAFNVICRLEVPEAGMAHVAAAVRPGGLLLIDQRSADAHLRGLGGFTEIEAKIHRRNA